MQQQISQSVRARIDELEQDFLACLAGRSSTTECARRMEELRISTAPQIRLGVLEEGTMKRIEQVASLMRVAGLTLGALEEQIDRIEHDLVQRTRKYLSLSDEGPHLVPDLREEVDPFHPLRLWFLDHFTNPYPDSQQKEHFRTLYPTQTKQQLDTWFTNLRRRSGWQDLKRRYTDGTPQDFVRLVEETEQEARSFVVEEARLKIEQVKLYLREGVREKVRDEIQQLVEKGPPSTHTVRQIAPKTKRGGGEGGIPKSRKSSSSIPVSGAQTLSAFDFSDLQFTVPTSSLSSLSPPTTCSSLPGAKPRRVQQASTPSRTPRPSFFESSLVASPATTDPPQLSPQPRYPSSFASPSTSVRSFSNSSSSSFDSVLSYDSSSSSASICPSSPPATSSLVAFQTPSSSARSTLVPVPTVHSSQPADAQTRQAPIDNPYFFTLNNTPLLPLPPTPDAVIATSSLAGFATNGDLIV